MAKSRGKKRQQNFSVLFVDCHVIDEQRHESDQRATNQIDMVDCQRMASSAGPGWFQSRARAAETPSCETAEIGDKVRGVASEFDS